MLSECSVKYLSPSLSAVSNTLSIVNMDLRGRKLNGQAPPKLVDMVDWKMNYMIHFTVCEHGLKVGQSFITKTMSRRPHQ